MEMDYDESLGSREKNWAVVLHLSQLAGYAVPVAGFAAPVAIWLLKKEDMPSLDQHGRNVLNWIITELIYGVVALILCLVGIGFLLLFVLGIVGVVFPIIGAIKASDGVTWKYPLTISLI